MKKTTKSQPATTKPSSSARTPSKGVGAQGSRTKPKTGDDGPKWPGGGKKGEDE